MGGVVPCVGFLTSTSSGIIVISLEQVVATEDASWRIRGDCDSRGLAGDFLAGASTIIVVVDDFIEVEQPTENFGGDSGSRVDD